MGAEDRRFESGHPDMQEAIKYYEHYKTKNIYLLIDIGRHSETLEEMVIYKSMKDGKTWVRPRSEFFGTVTIDGIRYARFHWVWDHEGEAFRKKHEKDWET